MKSKKKALIMISGLLILAAVLVFLYIVRMKTRSILTPFFMGMIIAYLFHPLVIKLERKKIKRMTGVLLVYAFFLLTLAAASFYVVPEIISNIKDLIVSVPQIASNYQNLFNDFMNGIESGGWPEELKNTIVREIDNGIAAVEKSLTAGLKKSLEMFVGFFPVLFDLILAMIIAYYFIKDAEFFREKTVSIFPRSWRNELIAGGREINGIMSNFIQGQLLTALIVGILETIGLFIIKSKYPLVLGFIGGVANIIPYFGPVLGAIPAVAISLIESPVKALWTAGVFVVVQQLDNALISPKIIEGRLGLHPVATILAVLIGEEFFGITGMLLGVPAAAIIKVIFNRIIKAIV